MAALKCNTLSLRGPALHFARPTSPDNYKRLIFLLLLFYQIAVTFLLC